MPVDPLPPRYTDRFRVPDDYKKLTLEVVEESRDPPAVGIFDLPYRCYIVNEEWDKHISGAVSVLAEWRAWNGDNDDRDTSVQAILDFLAQDGDCSVSQLQVRQNSTNPCILEFSVNDGVDWVEFADILDCITPTFFENSIIDALNTNTTIQDIIDELVDGGTDNDLPPTPTSAEPDLLCDAAYYITDKIIDFIDDTLTDASTITLEEFLEALLGLGGFEASLLKLFWDFIVANTYPDLLTDVQAARDEVAEIIYCNELDKDDSVTDIDASTTIGAEAQAALIGAINAITDGKWSLWAFVGSQVDSGEDCSSWNCCEEVEDFDFLTDAYDTIWFKRNSIANIVYVSGQGWQGQNPGGTQMANASWQSITSVSGTYSVSAGTLRARIFQYASSTGTLGALIGTLPWTGDVDIDEDILVVIDGTSGTWTSWLESLHIEGCKYPES